MAQRKKASIYIKPSHRGLFTKWCKRHGFGGVTNDCIRKALSIAKRRHNAKLAKQAAFAKAARKWKHGGK